MNTPFPTLSSVGPHPLPTAAIWWSPLLVCSLIAGCQSPSFSTAFSGKKADTQSVSQSQEAGLPQPTNMAASNAPVSLTSLDDHLRLGEQELERGNYQAAQKHFDQVLEKSPNHVKAHHRLGVLADKLNQFEQAEQHYLTALNGDPRNAALLSDLGYSYFMQGRYADSERYLLEARKFDPNYHTAVANLGLLYASTGREQEAVAMFRQIGDEAQVKTIMQQVASGQFSPKPKADNTFAGEKSSVVTTTTTVQPGGAAQPQEMNDATRDFVEEMRKAREELRRAEEQFAQHQQSLAAQHASSGPPPAAGPVQPPAWSQQGAPASQPAIQQPPPYNGGMGNGYPPAQANLQGGSIPDSALSGAMAAIDRRDHPAPASSPIIIGRPETVNAPPGGPANQLDRISPTGASVAATDAAAGRNGSRVPVYTGSTPQAPPAASYPQPYAQADAAPSHPPSYWGQQSSLPTVNPAQNSFSQTASNAPSNPPSSWAQQFAVAADQTSSAQTLSRPNGNSSTPNNVWPRQGNPTASSPIQQTGGTADSIAPQAVEHAYHTQQGGQQQSITLAGQQVDSPNSLAPPPMNSNWNNAPTAAGPPGANAPPAADSYEQARREAAWLGLNAGPGQVFPYIQQTQRLMPGTDSRINGAAYPSPARHMPTGLIPPGYNATAQHLAPPQAPGANGFSSNGTAAGQPMPAGNRTAYGPPHAGMSQQQSYQNAPSQPPTADPYQDVRTQQAAQFNGLVNQTWGQSPQSPPYGVTPPSALQHYGSATTYTPPPNNVAPAQYNQQADASGYRQTQQTSYQATDAYGRPIVQQPAEDAAVAEPYRRTATKGDDQQPLPIIQARQWENPPPSGPPAYATPSIVPNQR